jgi:hypothetical protein
MTKLFANSPNLVKSSVMLHSKRMTTIRRRQPAKRSTSRPSSSAPPIARGSTLSLATRTVCSTNQKVTLRKRDHTRSAKSLQSISRARLYGNCALHGVQARKETQKPSQEAIQGTSGKILESEERSKDGSKRGVKVGFDETPTRIFIP